jgi:hypothetical protein
MPAPSVRATSSVTGATGSTFSVNKPAGTQQGDILLAFQATALNGGSAPAAPSGWTDRGDTGFGGGSCELQVFWLLAGASEPSSYTFNNASGGLGGTADVWLYALLGAISTGPDGSLIFQAATSSAPKAPSRTTSVNNELLCCAFAVAANDTITPPGDLTDLGTLSATVISLDSAYRVQASAGATGDETASSGTHSWCGVQVAIKPAVSACLRNLIVSNPLHQAFFE